jgi:putative PIN family toxin of toxin-antitoxin system
VPSVTADTNIYISGLNFSGPPRRFLNLARAGGIRLAISEALMEETLRVLREKFHWPEDAVREAEANISEFAERVKPSQAVDVIHEDPADNRVLECAVAAKSDFIVTGINIYCGSGATATSESLRWQTFWNCFPRLNSAPAGAELYCDRPRSEAG